LREQSRPGVFEIKVLRRIFGPKRDEVTGEWRRLHKEELCALHSSPNEIGRACSTYGVKGRCIQGFDGKT
jgi:hypothetical protein